MIDKAKIWIGALRIEQWVKNIVVIAAYVFARADPSQTHAFGFSAVFDIALAVLFFCLISSSVYLFNDARDVAADRRHPQKCKRPVASGAISVKVAYSASAALAGVTFALSALFLPTGFVAVIGAYVLMQLLYTCLLKRYPYIDVFVISTGFVLRAIAGAVAIDVRISSWLLLCTFLLSLFLALCKRRHEKLLLADAEDAIGHRESLEGYDCRALDAQIAVTAASTVVCYAIYTLSAETARRFGTDWLGVTVPFVVFGIFRYLALVYRHEAGGRPERVMLTDRIMLATLVCYAMCAVAVLFLCKNPAVVNP